VGLLTALVCVIIAIVVLLKIRSANNKKSNNKQRPGNLPIKEKISMPLSQSEEMYDEKNPDVVPSTEGENENSFTFLFFLYSILFNPIQYLQYQFSHHSFVILDNKKNNIDCVVIVSLSDPEYKLKNQTSSTLNSSTSVRNNQQEILRTTNEDISYTKAVSNKA
jgi:hypothetical protein